MFRLQKLSSLVPVRVALPLVGCVQRTLSIDTNAGALVVLNDREVGRTPFTVPFTWYGAYDVVVRADGFRTIKTSAEVTAPWWQWVPFDLLTDFLPVADRETLHFDLKPETPTPPATVLARAMDLRGQLESSGRTVRPNVLDIKPATRPATEPAD